MLLINCKVELKLRLTKQGVLFDNDSDCDSVSADTNNIIFTTKNKNSISLSSLY